jgi:hypothetical protein
VISLVLASTWVWFRTARLRWSIAARACFSDRLAGSGWDAGFGSSSS